MENAKFIPKVQSNCNIHHFDNVINDDITDFDSIINHMLPSLNDNYYQDNYEQFMLDRADDDVFDPMLLFCNEISENHFVPLIEQEFSEVKPLVQVNDNSDNNNVTIVVHKDVDVPEQEFGSDRLDEKLQEEEFELEEPIPLQVWNDYLVYDNIIPCSQCQVLRQIMHTNGTQSTKLEIHGGVGVISHAILVNHRNSNDDETTPGIQDYQMIDFSNISVKEYLEKYLEERQQNGYILLRDPLSSFYEALCIGYDWLSPNNLFTPHDSQTKTSVGEQSIVQKDHGETSYQVKDNSRKRHHHHHHRHDVKVTHNAKDKLAEANKQAPKMPRMELSVQLCRGRERRTWLLRNLHNILIYLWNMQLKNCVYVILSSRRNFVPLVYLAGLLGRLLPSHPFASYINV
ncbi:uncharacterized protein LOC141615195 [Silene latifolia]|uniref:uncharacterized protein LOC141615195 n=1 Tax=Silene latifolia TaxID=37657 RepID=UPI003D76FC22